MIDLPAFYRRLQDHFSATLADAPPAVAAELQRLGVAPFASDPALTLRPCPLLVVSMKPYGAPGRTYPHGWEERKDHPGLHRWYDGGRATGNFVREADLLVRTMLAELAPDLPPRAVPNTYAYFYRAQDAKQLKSFGLDRIDCTAFHREILTTVAPRVVLCVGNGPVPSAYATYREMLAEEVITQSERVLAPAPRIKVKVFRAEKVLVIGVPHLSYVRAETVVPTVVDCLVEEGSS